jgi:hypothetical protein
MSNGAFVKMEAGGVDCCKQWILNTKSEALNKFNSAM